MAELGDLLSGGSGRAQDVTIEMLDYDFLNKCTDTGLMRAIVRKLKSGEEGHYPDLVKHAETRLLEELPPAERSKILRMKAQPQPDEVHEATYDLHCWEEEMAKISSGIKENSSSGQHRRAPKWTSCAKTDDECRNPKVVDLTTLPGDGSSTTSTQSSRLNEHKKTEKLNAYDFRSWEKYNADHEIGRLEAEEEEEERLRNEAITSAKTRAEQDALRRTKKREEQLREASKGRFKESLSSFEKKRAAEREHQKGNESFKAKEYEEAFRCYSCSLALDDANARVYSNRAATAHNLKRFEQAEDDCTRAISLDVEFKRAWMRRGMVRHSRGKYADSVADFTEALRLDPSDKHARKLKEHSAAKEREVEGERVRETHGEPIKKQGRVLIEEVDTLQDDGGKDSNMSITTTIAAPPPIVGSKRTMIARGWMDAADEELCVNSSR